jgi:hypothetical protein
VSSGPESGRVAALEALDPMTFERIGKAGWTFHRFSPDR